MPVSADYQQYVLEQLAGFASLRARRMFGGVGLYADEVFFALIDDDTLYFKVDDTNREDYVARGASAFRPFENDPAVSLSYYAVPADVLEDVDELREWARKAARVAAAAHAARARRKRRPAQQRKRVAQRARR